jgi:hypothetical protein
VGRRGGGRSRRTGGTALDHRAGERFVVAALIELPRLSGGVEQQIGFGARPTAPHAPRPPARTGAVHVLTWASHVERGLQSPAYNPSDAHFAEHYQFVHYDGCGTLLDRNVKLRSRRVADLEAVIDGLAERSC